MNARVQTAGPLANTNNPEQVQNAEMPTRRVARGWLQGVSSNVYGLQVALTRPEYRLGRAPHLEVRLPDATAGELQCVLTRNPDGSYTVTNRNPNGGTRVNGMAVDTAELANGDVLTLGHSEFTCYVDLVEVAAPTAGIPDLPLEELLPAAKKRRGWKVVEYLLLALDTVAAAAACAALALL